MERMNSSLPSAVGAALFDSMSSEALSVELPCHLSGQDGINRNRLAWVPKLIIADNDLAAIESWIGTKNSEHTRRAYRREALRLMIWSVYFQGKPISSLLLEDIGQFVSWLKAPVRHEHWPAEWCVIRSGLSVTSLSLSLTILKSMFGWLCGAGYLVSNPFSLFKIDGFRKSAKEANKSSLSTRYFEDSLWEWLLCFVEKLPRKSKRDEAHYQRIRFVLHFGYLTGARREELVSATMSDFTYHKGEWLWEIHGKGSKLAKIPLNDDAMTILGGYRVSRGMAPLPDRRDGNSPLIARLYSNEPVKVWMLHHLLTDFFAEAAKHVSEFDPAHVQTLEKASTHWLRHTMATHAIDNGIPLNVVADRLRHDSVETTRRNYIHDNLTRQSSEFANLTTLSREKP